jgi:hypothetical protein
MQHVRRSVSAKGDAGKETRYGKLDSSHLVNPPLP